MEQLFPRTTVGGLSLSRMIMGTNWLLGWSHTGAAADKTIRERYDTKEKFLPVLEAYLSCGVDTIMGPFGGDTAKNLLASIQRRFPDIEKRSSPVNNQAAVGNLR